MKPMFPLIAGLATMPGVAQAQPFLPKEIDVLKAMAPYGGYETGGRLEQGVGFTFTLAGA